MMTEALYMLAWVVAGFGGAHVLIKRRSRA